MCVLSIGGKISLHFAAEMGHVDVAAALLDEAAQELIVMKDEGNWTALHHAAEQGSLEIVELLLQVSVPMRLPPTLPNACCIRCCHCAAVIHVKAECHSIKNDSLGNLGSTGLRCTLIASCSSCNCYQHVRDTVQRSALHDVRHDTWQLQRTMASASGMPWLIPTSPDAAGWS